MTKAYVHDTSAIVLNVAVQRRLACATCRHRRVDIGKAFVWILEDSGERRRIAFLVHAGKAKMPNKNPWQRRVMLYVRRVSFIERLCKYFRRRNGIIRKRNRFVYGSKGESRFHDWIGYFAKGPADNRCYRINKLFLQSRVYRKHNLKYWSNFIEKDLIFILNLQCNKISIYKIYPRLLSYFIYRTK